MADQRQHSVGSNTRKDDLVDAPRNGSVRRLSVGNAATGAEQTDARAAFDVEKHMTVRQALRLYKKAVLFSMIMSLAVVMEG